MMGFWCPVYLFEKAFPISTLGTDTNIVGVLAGGGEMGALMRTLDWSSTSVGSPGSWPDSFRSALGLCLNTEFPVAIYWGADRALFYNDAWRPIVGDKHPSSMGRPAHEVWPEIWDVIGPLFDQVHQTGEGIYLGDQLLEMHRFGFREECYFNFTFSPVKDQGGAVGGIFNIAQETTNRVIGERRLTTLHDLGAQAASRIQSVESACDAAIETLRGAKKDIPFAGLYLSGQHDGTKIFSTHPSANMLVEKIISACTDTSKLLPLAPLGVEIMAEAWEEPVQQAIVIPLGTGGQEASRGFLVAGVSPVLAFNEEYRGFFDLLARQIGITLANATTFEEEKKRAEALAELDRVKTAFFSNISHEFRTPLTLMLAPLEDMLASSSADKRELLSMAHYNALRLQKLVNNLLDFSRIQEGRAEAYYQPTDLSKYTAELASTFRSAIEKAGLTLTVQCPDLPELIFIDREMWEKIVLNLLSNAFKHTFEGGITVEVSHVGNAAEVSVRDTGVGVPADQLPYLFERFHRVPHARSRTHEGSGIGLALVQELVKFHGGEIRVESVPDKGSVFTVSIPMGKQHLPADRIETNPAAIAVSGNTATFVEEAMRWLPGERTRANGTVNDEAWPSVSGVGKARVVLADDNTDMRDYVERLLSPYCEVIAVADGRAALETITENPPDMILSDVMMPEMDGFELLNAVRSNPELKSIPMILLSARAGEEAKISGLEAGADDYLIKPFTSRELLVRVKTNLELSRIRREAQETALENQFRFRTLADNIPNLAWMANAEGWIFWYNNRWYEYTGTTPEDMEGWGWQSVHDPRTLPTVMERWKNSIATGEPFQMVFPLRAADGTFRSFLTRIVPVKDTQGKIINWFGTNTDISEQRQQEEDLKHANQLLDTISRVQSRFIAGADMWTLFDDLNKNVLELTGSDFGYICEVLYKDSGDPYLVFRGLTNISWDAKTRELFEQMQSKGLEFHNLATLFGVGIVNNGSVVISNDVKNDPRGGGFPAGHPPVYSFMGLPIYGEGDKLVGQLAVANCPAGYTEQQAELLQPLLTTCGNIIEAYRNNALRVKSEKGLRWAFERENLLRRIVEYANQKKGIDSLLNIVAEEIGRFYQVDRAYVIRFEQEGQYLNMAMSGEYYRSDDVPKMSMKDFPPEVLKTLTRDLPIDDALDVQRFNTAEEYRINLEKRLRVLPAMAGKSEDEIRQLMEHYNQMLFDKYCTSAVLRVGVRYRGMPYGMLSVQQCDEGRVWTDDELELLQDIATQLGAAIYQSELYKKEQKARREAEDASRKKSQFLANMSHELRTPLNAVLGYSSLMRQGFAGELTEKQEKYARNIEVSGKHLLDMVNDILDVAKIEAGKIQLVMKKVDLEPLMKDLHDVLSGLAEQKKVILSFDLEPGLRDVVADPARLRQIFFNLISNAIKFNKEGGTVEVCLFRDQGMLVGEVKDTGIGIPVEKQSELFSEFYQVDASTSRTHEGTGLGLALTKKLVELHNGSIGLESEVGVGSTFTFRLPLTQPLTQQNDLESKKTP